MRSEAIDILKLYANGNANEWNAFLRECLAAHDLARLVDVQKRLQMGMDNLVKQKHNTEKVSVLFLRLQRSIENTIKQIYRAKNPNPLFLVSDKTLHDRHLSDKRKKNDDLEKFMRRSRW